MCGLVGELRHDGRPVGRDRLAAMRDALAHRGPDASGLCIDGSLGLGHRRLAVIDLSPAANQPMSTPDGRTTVILNGEIYNFRELRAELERAGHRFRTRSDTEVLLWGYRQWGIEGLARRLDAMAAFALWDAEARTLHLVRDRYGIKPLYLWRSPGALAFASEIKAFLAAPEFSVSINRAALREYFTFQNLFRPHTLFAGVELLPAGTILTLGPDGERRRRYWDFDFSRRDETIEEEAAVEETRRLLLAAVERQLIADVPVGAYLSGGMDSGSLVAGAARRIPRLATFTAGFEMSAVDGIESTFDERRAAELTAYHFKTEHYEQVINSGDVRWAVPRLVWHLEDLRLGMSYPNYYIARLASKFVTVCLSGAGGDELFGGYPWRYYRVFRALDRESYLRAYYHFWQRLTTPEDRRTLFRDGNGADEEEGFAAFSGVFAEAGGLFCETPDDHVANALYFESKTFLHGLFIVGDRLSMANGLEERFPFMDNALVEWAQRLPIRYKLADLGRMLSIDEDAVRKKTLAMTRYDGGKSVLRRAMAGLLPAGIWTRPKQGFSPPEGSWYRGENAAYVRELLLGADLAMADHIEPAFVRRIVEEHIGGRANHRLLIWSFLCFEWWCRVFLRGERPA
ncbi:MAG: asparagine synthase (glutamine-hydrolyzing) [Rhodospirillaceae bacterium]|nr:asparagine synthase (glutamine-hydrolyzing) [Rhodospirillaceae bacterium]